MTLLDKYKARNVILYVTFHLFIKVTVDSAVLVKLKTDVKDHIFLLYGHVQRFGKPHSA